MFLRDIEVTNFRSIKGRVVAPLDAKIVLLHGENGAGKTSLLSAIELALTGRVLSLERVDPAYATQLLHRLMQSGRIELATDDAASFEAVLSPTGAEVKKTLPARAASFFSERCYLPQSLLSQLLQIYQNSDDELNSPLARFVGELLGLDRLDALDAGLKPLADLRNFRKIAEGYSGAETEKSRLERLLADHRRNLETIGKAIESAFADLNVARITLSLPGSADEASLDQNDLELSSSSEQEDLTKLSDHRRQLEAIHREASRNQEVLAQSDEASLSANHAQALSALKTWQEKFETRVTLARRRAEALLQARDLPTSPEAFHRDALRLLRSERDQATDRSTRAALASERRTTARGELEVARKQLATIDEEIGRIAPSSGDLGSVLAELTSFIADDICPVCDRNFAELRTGPLTDHVHRKVRTLSSSAQRLLELSRTRGQQQIKIEGLEREIEALASRLLDAKTLADLSRKAAELEAVLAELEALSDIVSEGERLTRAETAVRRALTDFQSRNLARTSIMTTLRDFSKSADQREPEETETAEATIARLTTAFRDQVTLLNHRLEARRRGVEAIRNVRAELVRRQEANSLIESDSQTLRLNTGALTRAAALRVNGQTIRAAVETVRAQIIRREFNDRLNRLWRDLFIRLAPNEPFVPAFRIPQSSTQRLQPKLITEYRGGGSGGTPGAMLSGGNLNTAALTLFIALHLTVPSQLPWLILDDPVQSMDDIHIANFSALLRTLAKEHGRQVLIAVHDRQLFEYLRLELSPAYPEDSLLALELSRGAHRDSICVAERRSYHEETALRVAA